MNDTALKTVVAEWLEQTCLPARTARSVEKRDLERTSEVLAIVGPRRAGKTFLMFQFIEELLADGHKKDDILFVDFEDYRLVGFRPEHIDSLLAAFEQLTGKAPRFLFFDEVQHLPNWSRVLRTLHNHKRFSIVVSGSNSQLLTREVATELRGRYEDILMLPFSFAELLRHRGVKYTAATLHTPGRGKLLKVFDEYSLWGGYPEILARTTASEKRQLLQRYLRTIFFRDIIERYGVRAKALLEAMMSSCLNNYSDLFSISAFEKQLRDTLGSTSKRTIANYLRYLEEAFFIVAHEKFSFSPRKRIMNPKKVYLIDNGFRALGVEFSENRGKALENSVAIELTRRRHLNFYHHDRYECDFVVMNNSRPGTAIQVAWELNAGNHDREFRGLIEAMDSFKIKKGLILTYNDEGSETYRRCKFDIMPVWKWMSGDLTPPVSPARTRGPRM